MLDSLIKELNIKITKINSDYIPGTKSRGMSRWDFEEKRGEIILAGKADRRTLAHEIGHVINFHMGKGEKYSHRIGIGSEEFANVVADLLISDILKK